MSISVALEHRTTYRFDRPTELGPHLIRLRPAPHCRTPISSYVLAITPEDHFLNWQQDPYGNFVGRVVFGSRTTELSVTVGLVANLETINPFDFFVEDYAADFPFVYPESLKADLAPYLQAVGSDPVLTGWLAGLETTPRPTVNFLVGLNSAAYGAVNYSTRMEPGVQPPEQTISTAVGSCRDSAWLLVAALRNFGVAARFVSGYLVQLGEDSDNGRDGGGEPKPDSTDLHAWAEAYVPGAGWIGLDPTSGLLAGEGHIPLAATPSPGNAAPIDGTTGAAEVTFDFANSVHRFTEDARTSKPYTRAQREALHDLGAEVDGRLTAAGLELTMGGEPTFVLRDEPMAPEWTVAPDGGRKRELAGLLAARLADAFAAGGVIQHSQGRWYPGEPLPRWQVGVVWRRDGVPLWRHRALLVDPREEGQPEKASARAEAYAAALTSALGLPRDQLLAAYERQADEPAAWVLPLTPAWWGSGWASPRWRTGSGRLELSPGELSAGQRLPLDSLTDGTMNYPGEDSYLHPNEDLAPSPEPNATVVELSETPSRTATIVQPRDGHVHVFLPPLERAERFVELVGLLDRVAGETGTPLVLEGYGPPPDPRVTELLVTPDPGVLEVNLHPAGSWGELAETTATVYRLADELGLGTETFGLDGRHSGTGGGNHWTLGAAEPVRSPLLRRPDLLVSLLTYWQHHPALSYAFSGRFVGATSQAPRVDEGRPEAMYELEIAFAEIERLTADPGDDSADAVSGGDHRPWAVDRALRHLLADLTGNAHRSEFCIDKLYSPDSLRGRLGLLELRAFEMPPHPDLALAQALLIRSILARCAEEPYRAPLIRWGTRLHEQYLLPHWAGADLADVVADLRSHGLGLHLAWFAPFLEFRFPLIGRSVVDAGPFGSVDLELRTAIEPWPVLGDEATSGGAARYVDSSVERLQVTASGFDPDRLLLVCNGSPVPLAPTTTSGRFVAGVRYKAWTPWSARHPSLGIDTPLAFEVVDRASRLSRGGATYHVVHPGGRSYVVPPVNAKEAEARRARRFEANGRATGLIDVEAIDAERGWRAAGGDEFPATLDLRRRVPRSWGRS